VAETDADAQELADREDALLSTDVAIEMRLWGMSYASGGEIDYAKFDLDGPVPTEIGNGETTSARQLISEAAGMTLRELVTKPMNYGIRMIGSFDSVAVQMGEAMQVAGPNSGFLIYQPVTRHHILNITDGLCPALRKRGLIRSSYEYSTFRENLFAF
jgi:alkanesulfonate monooxygenase SsuD/methylene tetrahydromethanopterin reductase-like flavin-dependent oxidoreductase (luciferase family)